MACKTLTGVFFGIPCIDTNSFPVCPEFCHRQITFAQMTSRATAKHVVRSISKSYEFDQGPDYQNLFRPYVYIKGLCSLNLVRVVFLVLLALKWL